VLRGAEAFEGLRVGMKQAEVAAAVGSPAQKLSSERYEVWVYQRGERTWNVTFDKAAGGVLRVAESLPGHAEMIVVQ